METQHPEGGESPFIVKDDASVTALLDLDNSQDEDYVCCPVEGCGEALLLTELESHIEMHEEEQDSPESDDALRSSKRVKLTPEIGETFDTKLSYALRNLSDDEGYEERAERRVPEEHSSDRHAKSKAAWGSLLKMPKSSSQPATKANTARRRLGVCPLCMLTKHVMLIMLQKSELGPHAHEKQMPSWLIKLLEDDGAMKTTNQLDGSEKLRRVKICPNMTAGIVPVIAQLVEQDETVEYAYLCDPAVKHVSKLRREGKPSLHL